MTILVGTDPEILVERDGKIFHCIGMLGGDKDSPRKVRSGHVQEDNVLFEFNIPAADNAQQFSDSIVAVMSEGLDILGDRFSLSDKASHIFSDEELQGLPESAFVFGCEADYNGFDMSRNPSPRAQPGLRSAGGHIHFGFDHVTTVTQQLQQAVIVSADYFMGLESVLLDKDDRRKELYGKAGACRMKGYGAEYRTLSNFWIFSEQGRKWAFEHAQKAYEAASSGHIYQIAEQLAPAMVQEIINTGDKARAEKALRILEAA